MKARILDSSQRQKFLSRCEELIRQNHGRMTKTRQQIFRSFSEADQPVGAYDIQERLKDLEPSIDVTTIYRNIELLAREGLIHKSGDDGWVACSACADAPDDVHVLISCPACLKVSETSLRKDDGFVKSLGPYANHSRQHPLQVIVHGFCESCEKNSSPS